ncbi:MAG: hypothetical protein JWO80_3113 [Bryobacterales bacterium]|nr:hypothetical protein [Bryobacterales bacterium]
MCRNIKVLRIPGKSATDEESHDAALQFVRKISGFRKPSKVNEEAFERAVREVAEASRRLLAAIERPAPQRGERQFDHEHEIH